MPDDDRAPGSAPPDYRRMLESVNAIVWHADPATFQTTYTSGVAVEILGYPLEAWTREPGFWLSHVHPDDQARVVAISSEAIAKGQAHDFEYRMIAADGRVVWLRNIVNVVTRAGVAVDLVGVTTNITERKEAEQEAAQLRQELARLTRAASLSELSSYLAHELNQPLGAIVSNAEVGLILLRDNAVPAERVACILRDIHRDAERGAAVITHLQELLSNRRTERHRTHLGDVVADLVDILQPLLVAHRVHVRSEIPTSLPDVSADRVQLQQVIANLMANAIDALKQVQSQDRQLVITAHGEDSWVELDIADNGPGIPPELMPRLFQPFATAKPGGTGIGLAMCRRIVEAHCGTLHAINNPGHGATFRVRLPVAAAPDGSAP